MSEIKKIDSASFIGRQLGNVTILRELGRGAMGIVFVGFQQSLKRQVAVKTLPKAIAATNEKARRQFRDEAEIIAGLSHPNIIPIIEIGETDEVYFQVMHLITGRDLRTIIKHRLKHPVRTKRVLPLEETLDIMIQVLGGLAYAHDEGVIHQDIKPANILMEERTARPLIADFGIAHTAQIEYQTEDVIVGTPTYLAPEQARRTGTDGRTDVYSAGIILFELLAGNLPIRAEPVRDLLLRKLHEPGTFFISPPSEVSPLVDAELEGIVLRATAPEQDDRYPDAFLFQEDLMKFRDRVLPRTRVVRRQPT